MQYKMLTQEQGSKLARSSHFSPAAMQEEINAHAADGWRVLSMTAGAFPPFKHDVLVVLLEHP